MMVSPQTFIDFECKDKSYKELLKMRDRLIRQIRAFEKGKISEKEYLILPSPKTRYQMNLEYLGELCKLISEKYNEEFIWNDYE